MAANSDQNRDTPDQHETDPHEEDVQNDAIVGKAVRASLFVLVAIGAGIGAFFGVRSLLRKDVAPLPRRIVNVETRDLTVFDLPQLPFTDITESSGVSFVHDNALTGKKLLPETMVGGVATFDYDGDGDADLLLIGGTTWPNEPSPDRPKSALGLFRNDGTGTFEDVTNEAGLTSFIYAMGAAVGDYDNDGDLDLYITALGPNRLFRNEGGSFLDVTDLLGVAGAADGWSSSAGFVDYDRDGDLDLAVGNYVEWSREYDLAQNFQLVGDERAYGRPLNFGGTFPTLYRNDGDTFADVSEAAGLNIKNPDTGVPAAKSLGLAIHDFDDDGWLDLCFANDTVRNFLFRNKQDGTFEEVGEFAGIAYDDMGTARGAMGIDVARFRSDQTVGIAIGNFANEMTALFTDPFGALSFTDEAVASGLGPQTRLLLTFGVLFVDADLDGRLDLFAANGHLEEDISKVQPSQKYEQPPQLFWNAGDDGETEFVPLTENEVGQQFLKPLVGRGSAAADFDLDGDLDLVIATAGQSPRLLRNDQQLGHHWLRVRVESDKPIIGTSIRLKAAESGTEQVAIINPTRSYLSQSELPVTFGLGDQTEIDALEITWPDGQVQTEPIDAVDQQITITRQ